MKSIGLQPSVVLHFRPPAMYSPKIGIDGSFGNCPFGNRIWTT